MFTKSPTDTSEGKTLDVNDWKSMAINTALVAVSAGVTYLVEHSTSMNFGEYTNIIGPVIFLGLKTVQKWLKDNTKVD